MRKVSVVSVVGGSYCGLYLQRTRFWFLRLCFREVPRSKLVGTIRHVHPVHRTRGSMAVGFSIPDLSRERPESTRTGPNRHPQLISIISIVLDWIRPTCSHRLGESIRHSFAIWDIYFTCVI